MTSTRCIRYSNKHSYAPLLTSILLSARTLLSTLEIDKRSKVVSSLEAFLILGSLCNGWF
jgi:hypothetical protein